MQLLHLFAAALLATSISAAHASPSALTPAEERAFNARVEEEAKQPIIMHSEADNAPSPGVDLSSAIRMTAPVRCDYAARTLWDAEYDLATALNKLAEAGKTSTNTAEALWLAKTNIDSYAMEVAAMAKCEAPELAHIPDTRPAQ